MQHVTYLIMAYCFVSSVKHAYMCDGLQSLHNVPLNNTLVRRAALRVVYLLIAVDEKLPLTTVLRIARDILRGLAGLHAKRILLEDFKPSNVLLEDDGRAVLADLDLGLARQMQASVIMTGQVAGSWFYM